MDSHSRTPSAAASRRTRLPALISARPEASLRTLAEMLASEGLSARDGRPYSAATIRRDLAELPTASSPTLTRGVLPEVDVRRIVQEIIGRSTGANNYWYSNRFVYTVDRTRHDYRFWDEFRNGLAVGYELVGSWGRPATRIKSVYVLGDAPTYVLQDTETDEDEADGTEDTSDNEEESAEAHTNSAIAQFVSAHHSDLLTMYDDMLGLGDQWVFINPDGSLTIPSPDTITPKYDPTNPKRLVEVEIRTSDLGTIIYDTYRADGRTLRIQRGSPEATVIYHYDNPIGRLPVVQFSNNRHGNELFGRADYEALLPVFNHTDDLILKQLQGARVMGNPIPTVSGLENIPATISANAAPTNLQYVDPPGQTVSAPQFKFDTDGIFLVGKGGDFKLVSPVVGFSKDMRDTVHQMFTLVLQHMGIPEILWGAVVEGTRASAEMQIPPFVRMINACRAQLDGTGATEQHPPMGGLFEVIDIWLRGRALTDPNIVVGPLQSLWPSVSEADIQTRLQSVIYARGQNWVSSEEGLALLNLVTDPATSVQKAKEEADALAAAMPHDDFMQRVGDEQTALNTAAHQQMNPTANTPVPERPKNSGKALPPLPGGGRQAKQADGTRVGEAVRE